MKLKQNLSHKDKITLNSVSLEELKWWCNNLIFNKGKHTTMRNLSTDIHSDAAKLGGWARQAKLKIECIIRHSVHRGINPPPLKNTTTIFLAKPSLKSANCPSPPFLGNLPLFMGFS